MGGGDDRYRGALILGLVLVLALMLVEVIRTFWDAIF